MNESSGQHEGSKIPSKFLGSCSNGKSTVFRLDQIPASIQMKLKKMPSVLVSVGGVSGACGACGEVTEHTMTLSRGSDEELI